MADGSQAFAPLGGAELEASPASVPGSDAWTPILPAPRALPDRVRHPRHGVPSTYWLYRGPAGELLSAVCRFDQADGGKEVLPFSCGADGWRWKALPSPRPLYGLDRLAARPAAPVLVVEGEKTADAAAALFPERVVVTWPGGSQAVSKADWTTLAGRHVLVWPDADQPGRKAATAVLPALCGAGAARAAVVDVPSEWPASWDLADPLPDGANIETLHRMLAAAAEGAPGGAAAPDEAADEAEFAAEIARLAALPEVRFERELRDVAARLRCPPALLKRQVAKLRSADRHKRRLAERELQLREPGAVLWPPGFSVQEHGLVYVGGHDDALPVTVAGPVEVLGESRTDAGRGWGLWLAWQDRDGRRHTWNMPRQDVMREPGAIEAALVERGLYVDSGPESRALLRQALSKVETTARVTLVHRAGWHRAGTGAPAYMQADGTTIGSPAEPMILVDPAEDAARRIAVAGTLEGWRNDVAVLARGNVAATFCIAAAFVGPLLEAAGEDGGGVHLFGPSRRGKTVALKLAASVWGPPRKDGALRDWRTTVNALEAACVEAADGLLTLDEIQQAEPRDVVATIYGMGNGGGKGRLRSDATARTRRTWRTFFLSNGEMDVPTIAARDRQRVPPGAEVRLPSIPLPAALWPVLHGHSDFQALCGALARASAKQHGTAGRAFVERVAARLVDGPEQLAGMLEQLRAAFLEQHVPTGADPQVRDVARRLALVAAAGEIATEAGILPWRDGEATAAAGTMFAAWRGRRGGTGSGEESAHLDKVRQFIVEHGASRMQRLDSNPDTGQLTESAEATRHVVKRAGWWFQPRPGEPKVYLFATDAWKTEVCEGLDQQEVAKTLRRFGHLEAGDGKNLADKRSIPGMGRMRVYAVLSSILAGDEPGG